MAVIEILIWPGTKKQKQEMQSIRRLCPDGHNQTQTKINSFENDVFSLYIKNNN